MKLHSALCIAGSFLATLHLARSGLEEAIRDEVGAIVEETYMGGPYMRGPYMGRAGMDSYNAADDAPSPAARLAIGGMDLEYYVKRAVPDKNVRQALIKEMNTVDPGEQLAEETGAMLGYYGTRGLQPDAPAHIREYIAMMEKYIPNQDLRHNLCKALPTLKLGDIKAKDIGTIVEILDVIYT